MKGHYKNILCVLSDSHRQDDTVAQALHIAKAHQASLTIMLSLESLPPNASMVMESFSYVDSQQTMETQAPKATTSKIGRNKKPYEKSGRSLRNNRGEILEQIGADTSKKMGPKLRKHRGGLFEKNGPENLVNS